MMSGGYLHIIWDWNGTLFDDLAWCVTIINSMLAHRGLSTMTLEQYRAVFSFPVHGFYQDIGFDLRRESLEALSQEFIVSYEAGRHTCTLYPDARTVLEHVSASGRCQSLLSAYAQVPLTTLIHALNIHRFFEHVIGLKDNHAHGKIEIGRRLIAALPYSPSEVLLVGDTLHDVEVAVAIGTACVLVAHGHQDKGRLQPSGVPVVDALHELYDII